MSYIRTFSDAAKQLTVVVHENAVSVTDDDGRVLSLPTDGKKVDERVENGLVKISRRNHWDTNTLVSEIDVENGPKIVRSYALSPGGTQLQITTSVNGGPRQTKFTRVYERPIESKN